MGGGDDVMDDVDGGDDDDDDAFCAIVSVLAGSGDRFIVVVLR